MAVSFMMYSPSVGARNRNRCQQLLFLVWFSVVQDQVLLWSCRPVAANSEARAVTVFLDVPVSQNLASPAHRRPFRVRLHRIGPGDSFQNVLLTGKRPRVAPVVGGIVDNTECAGVHSEIKVDPWMAHIKEPEANRLDIVRISSQKIPARQISVAQLGIVLQRG